MTEARCLLGGTHAGRAIAETRCLLEASLWHAKRLLHARSGGHVHGPSGAHTGLALTTSLHTETLHHSWLHSWLLHSALLSLWFLISWHVFEAWDVTCSWDIASAWDVASLWNLASDALWAWEIRKVSTDVLRTRELWLLLSATALAIAALLTTTAPGGAGSRGDDCSSCNIVQHCFS